MSVAAPETTSARIKSRHQIAGLPFTIASWMAIVGLYMAVASPAELGFVLSGLSFLSLVLFAAVLVILALKSASDHGIKPSVELIVRALCASVLSIATMTTPILEATTAYVESFWNFSRLLIASEEAKQPARDQVINLIYWGNDLAGGQCIDLLVSSDLSKEQVKLKFARRFMGLSQGQEVNPTAIGRFRAVAIGRRYYSIVGCSAG